MSVEIPREKWSKFFNEVSKKRFAWETKIEVGSDSLGKSVLSNGLYLSGITFEGRSAESCEIEISVSKDNDSHQTHNILNPVGVFYSSEDKYHDSTIEIKEANGTTTILRIFNPMPIMVGYAARHSV